jgi:hypothetical protein
LVERRLVAGTDRHLYLITESCDEAVEEIVGFYRNYDSMRYVGDTLVIRLRHPVDDDQLELLAARFGHLSTTGRFERADPFPPEVRDGDRLDLHRVSFVFARHGYGDLREMIDLINDFGGGAVPATPRT